MFVVVVLVPQKRKAHKFNLKRDVAAASTMPPPSPSLLLMLLLLLLDVRSLHALRCYVCGGHSGRPCDEFRVSSRRRSPYIRPDPLPGKDGSSQWTECNDLINNKGCMKQVVDDGE